MTARVAAVWIAAGVLLACDAEPDDVEGSSSTSGGASGSSGTTSTSSASATSTGTGSAGELATFLARLRADRDTTIVGQANGAGFPAPFAEGCLVVSTDPTVSLVAGDHDAWIGTPVTADSGFVWSLVPCVTGAHYKLVAGRSFFADPLARAYTHDDFGELSFVVAPAGVAHRERFVDVGAAGIAPRAVRVWVPAAAPTHVVFAADGQNLFEPDAPHGGWHLDVSAPAAMMIVGVESSPDRFDEYTHVVDDIGGGPDVGGHAAAYVAFVHDVIEPMIAARYGVIERRGVLGSSLGGLVSLVAADTYPGHYRIAMSLSGTVGWGSIGLHNETIIERMVSHGHQATSIYVDSGGGGPCVDDDGDGIDDDGAGASDNYCENAQLRDALASIGYAFDVDLFHWHEPGAAHDEAAWAARVSRPLGIFAGM